MRDHQAGQMVSATICFVSSSTFSAVPGSSAAVCSSSRRSFGGLIVAIRSVSAARCRRRAADRLLHPALKAHAKQGQPVAEGGLIRLGNVTEPAAAARREGEIFLDAHAGRAAAHGVLKETSDLLGALVLGG